MQERNFELISLRNVTRLDLILVLMRERNVSSIWIDVNRRELIGITRCSPLDSKGNPCWTLAYDKSQTQLCLASSSCWEKHAILCANSHVTQYSRILIAVLSLLSVSLLLSLLLYYCRRRQARERRRQFIDQAILSLQDLSLLDWWGDHLPTQALQNEQWETRGGRKILHVVQNFSWIFCPVCIWISIVRPDKPTFGGFVAWPVREKIEFRLSADDPPLTVFFQIGHFIGRRTWENPRIRTCSTKNQTNHCCVENGSKHGYGWTKPSR